MSQSAGRSIRPPEGILDGIHHVRIETPDLDGTLRGKLVDARKFAPAGANIMITEAYLSLTVGDDIADEGLGAPGTGYGDMILCPDWSTARELPDRKGVVTVLCDGRAKDGTDHAVHPRSVLKRVVEDVAADGLEAKFGIEFEFWIFRMDDSNRLALAEGRMGDLSPIGRQPHAYSLARWPDCADYFDDLLATMEAYGSPIESVMTESGRGMFEAALAPAPPVAAADAAARFKLVAHELAAKHGLIVSFIAKLDSGQSGSSGHVHQSLTRDGENVFWGGRPGTLSDTALHYVAGLLQATRECGVVMAPYPNSYRRFTREFFAPDSASWAYDNRFACVRAIVLDQKSSRFELRRPGADLQPYLTIATALAGGVAGIRTEAIAPEESTGSCEPAPGSDLPHDLRTAIESFTNSSLARQALGDTLVEAYTALRRTELRVWEDLSRAHIPDWELSRYLEVV